MEEKKKYEAPVAEITIFDLKKSIADSNGVGTLEEVLW